MKKNVLLIIFSFITYVSIAQNIGVGTTSPTNFFHISPSVPGNPIRVEGLQLLNNEQDILVTDAANGEIKYIPINQLADSIAANIGGLFTDDQNIDSVTINGTTLTVYIESGGSSSVDLRPIIDSAIANIPPSGGDNQNLSVQAGAANTSVIDIDRGDSVILQAGSNVTLSESGNTITISSTGDGTGTDDQNLDSLVLNGTILTGYIESGTSASIDLQPIIDSATAGSSNAWLINGNANTTSATNFLGTTNAEELVFRTNNLFSGIIGLGANGNLYLGQRANFSQSGTGGIRNIGVGYEALHGPTTGSGNLAIGRFAMRNNAGGGSNIGIGENVLFNNGGGTNNIAIGENAMYENSGGSNNIAIGENVLYNIGVSGGGASRNVAIGHGAMINTGTGGGGPLRNVAIGQDAFPDLGTGGAGPIGSTGVGGQVVATGNPSNATALGYQATVTASNQVRVGNASVSSIGGFANWSNVSDGRFKSNIKNNVPGLSFILGLSPVTYTLEIEKINEYLGVEDPFINELKNNQIQSGFIAQDVEELAKKIGYEFSGIDKPLNENGHYGLKYAEFVVPLVKAVQEQQSEIQELKKKLADQEANFKSQLEEIKQVLQEKE